MKLQGHEPGLFVENILFQKQESPRPVYQTIFGNYFPLFGYFIAILLYYLVKHFGFCSSPARRFLEMSNFSSVTHELLSEQVGCHHG